MPADMQYVLELINQAREVAELAPVNDLPKGRRLRPCDCPVARVIPGECWVQQDLVIWETFPGDSLPQRIADVWGEKCEYIMDRKDHMAEYIVTLPAEVNRWIREFDETPRWERYIG